MVEVEDKVVYLINLWDDVKCGDAHQDAEQGVEMGWKYDVE